MSSSGNTTVLIQNCLDRLRFGEEEALSRLIEISYRRLGLLANRMRRDYQRLDRFADAEDVLQGAALRLTQSLKNPPATAADFFRLAGTIIRNELIDLIRRYHGPHGDGANQIVLDRKENSSAGDLADRHGNSTLDPGRLAIWQEFHQTVERLPEEERDVFNLLWYHELTHEEAAEILSISTATLRRRWLAARLHLQMLLQCDLPEG